MAAAFWLLGKRNKKIKSEESRMTSRFGHHDHEKYDIVNFVIG